MEFKNLYMINGIVYLYKYNNGVYAVLEDVLTGYEEFVRLEELKQYEYKNLLWKLWKRLLEEKLQEFK